MELKLASFSKDNVGEILLIVPYGIETLRLECLSCGDIELLIVPYGIET